MTNKLTDDLEAVRTLVATLEPFDLTERERIIRWVREKLGMVAASAGAAVIDLGSAVAPAGTARTLPSGTAARDIRSFVA